MFFVSVIHKLAVVARSRAQLPVLMLSTILGLMNCRCGRGRCGIPALTALQPFDTIQSAMGIIHQAGKTIPGVQWLAVSDWVGERVFGPTLSLRQPSRRANRQIGAEQEPGLSALSLHQ